MAEVTLTDARNGAQIDVRVGDTVVVRLPENAAAGYRWTVTSIDAAKLAITEHRYEATRAGVGSAGASVWTFTPRQAGRTRLELTKTRPWDAANPSGDPFAVDITISDPNG